MNNNDTLPTPIESLSDLLETGDVTEKAFKVFVGHNLGHRVFLLQIPMHDFIQMSEVANDPAVHGDTVAQRKLDPAHAQKLAVYILKGLVSGAVEHRAEKKQPPSSALSEILERMGRQPYLSLQPLVANIRACRPAGEGIRGRRLLTKEEVTAGFEVFLSQKHVFWVIDGQHRRMAMKMVFDFLDFVSRTQTYPKKGSLFATDALDVPSDFLVAWQEVQAATRTFCKVSVEVHLGLETSQERQLFHDLNNLGKRVDKNLALTFDNSNPVNLFIKDTLHDSIGLKIVEKDAKEWKDDEGTIAWKDVVAVNSILFLNKTNIGGATPADVSDKADTAKRFWECINAIQGFGEASAREKTVAAQPVVLKALAKLVYDFGFSNRKPSNGDALLETLLSSITDIDFSHENPMWQFYNLSEEQRLDKGLAGLSEYLPSSETGNRDIGSFQEGVMRFGAKHNDIYPLIGDMIRWKLGLPNRQKQNS
jgi:hypothetical protein